MFHLGDGTVSKEYWLVPAQASAPISAVRAQLVPATVAVQPVTKAYVDASVAIAAGNFMSSAGGAMSGPLTLSGDPISATQAVTKRYADDLTTKLLPLSGGSLSGPLQAPLIGGVGYVSQYPGGSGSDNIVSLFSNKSYCDGTSRPCTGVADANYPTKEQPYSRGSALSPGPANSHLIDQRSGYQYDYFHDPAFSSFDGLWHAKMHVCNFTTLPGFTFTSGSGKWRQSWDTSLQSGLRLLHGPRIQPGQ